LTQRSACLTARASAAVVHAIVDDCGACVVPYGIREWPDNAAEARLVSLGQPRSA
jgi:hypothetical protein